MTVAELIEDLKKYNPTAKVIFSGEECIEGDTYNRDSDIEMSYEDRGRVVLSSW